MNLIPKNNIKQHLENFSGTYSNSSGKNVDLKINKVSNDDKSS